MSNLTRLYFDPVSKYKQYGLDGNLVPVVKDVDRDGVIETVDGDFVYLLFGMRRGGNDVFALDVSNKTAPHLCGRRTCRNSGSHGRRRLSRAWIFQAQTQNADNAVVVIGGGYDTVHDTSGHPASPDGVGAGIHILDLATGAELWRAGPDSGADLQSANMTRAFPNQIRVVDLSGKRARRSHVCIRPGRPGMAL